MQKEKWYDVLTLEHEILQRAMDVFKRELNKVINNNHRTSVLYCIIDFLITYGSEIHNRKEDEILFPELMRHKQLDQHQIHITSMEHATGRDILLSMFDEIGELEKRTPTYRKVYKQKGTDYLKYRFDHIWKENDIIFNIGQGVISTEQNQKFLAEFLIIDQSIQDGEYVKKAISLLEEMELGRCPEYKKRMMTLALKESDSHK
jgi:hemerythrin-like domain-containing protein